MSIKPVPEGQMVPLKIDCRTVHIAAPLRLAEVPLVQGLQPLVLRVNDETAHLPCSQKGRELGGQNSQHKKRRLFR